MSRAIHEISVDTRTLYDRIITAKAGDEITYAALSELIGRDVQTVARSALHSARKMAMRDHNVVFGVVRNEGLKRLADVEVVQTGEATVAKLRRVAKRGIRTITSVQDFAQLPDAAKIKHNTFASMFGAVAAMAKPASMKRLEGAVNAAQTGTLPIGRTLEAFTK